jgi:hypothetical protein
MAAVHGASAFSVFASLFFGIVGTEDDVLRRHTKFFQEAYPKLMRRPDVEDLRYPHAQMGTVLAL